MERGLATDAGDAHDAAGESELEDARLAEFYAFTYEDAVLVGTTGSPRALRGKDSPLRRPPSPTRIHFHHDSAGGPSVSHVAGATAVEEVPLISRETLDALIPPKTWRDESGKWQRVARATVSSRTDVIRLNAVFHELLDDHQARSSAICPVREKLFLQVFEELIRASACECPERGLLLLRLRDELRLTVQSYQTLYHQSIAYGRQKAVQADAGIAELETRIHELQCEQQRLGETQLRLAYRLQQLETEAAESELKREQRHRELVRFLNNQHTEFETFYRELTQETSWERSSSNL